MFQSQIPYSPEENTPAAAFEHQLDEDTKLNWRDGVMELQQEISYDVNEAMKGKELWAFVEGKVADENAYVARTYKDAELRKMKKMKEFGFNAIRFSHYPAGKDLLDACDEVGMYVMDESFDQWRSTKTKYDYANYFDAEC